MIGVGIIGPGYFGGFHARAVISIEGLELVAVAGNTPASVNEFAQSYGCRTYLDWRALVADTGVDVVVIATPHYLHTEIALEAARTGKAILLEKPMAGTFEESEAIAAGVTAAGVFCAVGFVNRFARAYQTAKQILDSGELGRVVHGTSTMSKTWMESNRRGWHLKPETGGGMWLTAGIHCLDRLTWLVGSSIREVTGRFATAFHDQEVDDVGTVLVDYRNGTTGVVVSVGYSDGAPKHLTELICSRGSMVVDYRAGVRIGRGERWHDVPGSGSEDWLPEAVLEEWRAFVRALEAGTESPVSVGYSLHIMEVALAARRSSETGLPVKIESRPL